MTDEEHPNERLVTPSEDGEGFDRSLVSRRSMLGGSALLAGLLAYTSDPTDPQLPGRASGSAAGIARASDNPDEPLIILGPESDPVGYLFQDTAGGIILQDATSGNHFWYNESQGRWETDAELDVPTLTAEQVTNDSGLTDSRVPLDRQTPIVEDWERQTLSYYTGDIGNIVFDTSTVLQGSASIRTSANGVQTLISPFSATRGFRYTYYLRFDAHASQDTQKTVLFIIDANNDGYRINYRKNAEDLRLDRLDAGSGTSLATSTELTIPTDEWQLLHIDLGWEDITVTTEQLSGTQVAQLTADDATHQSGWTPRLEYDLQSDEQGSGNHTYLDAIHRRPL